MTDAYRSELSDEEHQRFPGDWEAQVGQGAISFHSEETLASSDKGVVMLRRFMKEQIKSSRMAAIRSESTRPD